LNCGKRFRTTPSEHAERRFCCFSCCRKYRGETSIERAVREALERLHIPFSPEHPAGRLSIDFYLPQQNACLEIDGTYWHPDPFKDAKRDARLRELGYLVFHVAESEIKNASDLDDLIVARLQSAPMS
jgi:very-short-patch-repair endonuclease